MTRSESDTAIHRAARSAPTMDVRIGLRPPCINEGGQDSALPGIVHHTSSGNGTMVDLTVFIAIASATAAFSPSSEKG